MIFNTPAAHAGFFSFFEKLLGFSSGEDQAAITMTAQNMPLLSGTKNSDPEAGLGGGDITVVGGT
ncbi:MAG: hypothetical protein AAB930_01690, partial [Patescibacteria group bacterium]